MEHYGCVPRGGEHAQATSEKAAKADVGTFSMAAATHRVAVAAGALACSLGPSLRGRAAALAGLLEGTAVLRSCS